MDFLENWITEMLSDAGVATSILPHIKALILFVLLLLVAYLSLIITKLIIKKAATLFLRTSTKWDDILVEHKIFDNLAHIVPALMVKGLSRIVFSDFEQLLSLILKLTDVYIAVVIVLVIIAFLRGMEFLLSASSAFKNKPLASYFQLGRIIIYIATGIFVLSILMGRSPIYFLSAFGAMTAIILLIFKDTILGLVASVQISSNDMVRVGDWIEMPKYNADGDVLAINLNTVKVKNWDKTVTTVPTYYFITDSFKNWRGMQESGGRRIKRSIHVNVRSVKFVDKEMRERFERFQLVRDYVKGRQEEIEEYNDTHNIDTDVLINGRRMTNVGVFRQYITTFLKSHKGINQNMYILVRQLQPDGNGLPIEVYCFTQSVAWSDYEGVQADVFDHLLAAAKHFDLEVFQNPSGSDIIRAGEYLNKATNGKLLQN